MPVSFARLRILGFKSFAEPSILEIRPGLTGIVGPNGCGKSNVVEALRWAMGESSARTLRGGEMDDVIFAGTIGRPSRNIAEVALLLEDARGLLPPPLDQADEVEVVRRIERGHGSQFRVNGREARARDVQTLFADLASGARASAMVSQGRVSALVQARPEERRAILEEAAGITGLHARRHEAELKLRAAEANLARAEDMKGQLDGQLESLRRQARQANRYRTLSTAIRDAEAELLAAERAAAAAARDAARDAVRSAHAAVDQAAAIRTETAARLTRAAGALPDLRAAEAETRSARERLSVGMDQLTADVARAEATLSAARAAVKQAAADLEHARAEARDAAAAVARLAEEQARLSADAEAAPALRTAADAACAAAEADMKAAETASAAATERAADLAARRRAASEASSQTALRAQRLGQQMAALDAELRTLAAQRVAPDRLAAAEQEHGVARAAAQAAAEAAETASSAREAALREAAALRAQAQTDAQQLRAETATALRNAAAGESQAAGARNRLAAEAQALAAVLAAGDRGGATRLIDSLAVPPGLETAVGAALGEDLDSGMAPGAARFWQALPPYDPPAPLPDGAMPLAALLTAPPALARALSQIGVIADGIAPDAAALAPGQVLVTREGEAWRWDGHRTLPGAPSPASVRLVQRNRLAALRADLATATAAHAEASASHQAAAAAERDARTRADALERGARERADALEKAAAAAEAAARGARREAEARLDRARAAAATLAAQADSAATRFAAADAQAARLRPETEAAQDAARAAQAALAELGDPDAARKDADAARQALATARTRAADAAAQRTRLAQMAEMREQRLVRLTQERAECESRADSLRARLSDLETRAAQAGTALEALGAAPVEDAKARKAEAQDALDAAAAAHRRAADALRHAETESDRAAQAARDAETALAAAREAAVRRDAEAESAEAGWLTIVARVQDRLGHQPDLPAPPADIGPEAQEKLRRRLVRLQREREDMGPVNLRAEAEAEEVAKHADTLARERADLNAAIARLRGSIGHLNREGRERLSAVFEAVDRHFQALFARNFGGGRAHLALVGSDDPLLAGLEIYAQPPGKKLAALSLLSGGEQAMTALSLVFAVFRCNPAPVCVLDEVDAPLDDANTERFCGLLNDMVRETGTRFLVVTHSHLTMARMDRLYGVTMQERGVSRLLSVDLTQAGAMIEQPAPALA